MTTSQQIQVKTNFIASHLISEVAKWIKKNSDKEFFEVTKYKQEDLDKMITVVFQL